MKTEIKFRAFQDNQMLTSPISSNYGLARFFGLLYEDAVLMKFIGLKDKNGVEIYLEDLYKDEEGDVFKVIQLECGRYALKMIENNYVDEFIDWSQVEIIGNIYENPNLLK